MVPSCAPMLSGPVFLISILFSAAFGEAALIPSSAAESGWATGVPLGTRDALEELLRRGSDAPLAAEEAPEGPPWGSRRSLCILGSTGSVGQQALEVVRQFPRFFKVKALAASGSRLKRLAEQALEFRPEFIVVEDAERAEALEELLSEAFKVHCTSSAKRRLPTSGSEKDHLGRPTVLHGVEALENTARLPGVDCVLLAISGFKGLRPALAALRANKDVALATKEALVAAGPVFRKLFSGVSRNAPAESLGTGGDGLYARKVNRKGEARGLSHGRGGQGDKCYGGMGRLLPVDSEHSAIFQALQGVPPSAYPPAKLFLCASGGPFLGWTSKDLLHVKVQDALKHPKWTMGSKITVDSATLMNKGLEVIEAHEAFGVPYDSIRVLIHPQAILHSAVEMQDGAVIGQLGLPDMKLPIAYAFSWPHRLPKTFECLDLAFDAGRRSGLYPAALNAANEEAVSQFLRGRIHFTEIPTLLKHVMRMADGQISSSPNTDITLEDVEETDTWARQMAKTFIPNPTLSP
ncbi:uncharacterized protein LOC34622048 [Cyclospora cayetanensis]|uniref:1-deoxy-D-xylulose 5-phosphate reductoisomerase, apicoplastic n=1 Tax=Cyclospora cayetanensis TaxID=88456 RepID=A0A6P6RR34_9EIME|nr:uncharacterized protein LOC34622048 [Cyclospora cayetanensis]